MAYYEGATKPQAKPSVRVVAEHRCRTCGVPAILSDDLGASWFCAPHRPAGFFPHERRAPAAVAPPPPPPPPPPIATPSAALDSDEF